MSWIGMALMVMALEVYGLSSESKVDWGKLGQIPFLRRYVRPGSEELSPERLGRRIDDGLVEYLWLCHWEPQQGESKLPEWNSTMRVLEESISEHSALKAFKIELREKDRVPLASEIYLELIRRFINRQTGQGTRQDRRLPSLEEACQLAHVMLAPFMEKEFREWDWGRKYWARRQADSWLQHREKVELLKLIYRSCRSQVAWDTLQLISKGLAALGEEPPHALLRWYFKATTGVLMRPEEGSAPAHRRRTLGYTLRDNEFRHFVRLLEAVELTRESAYEAVEFCVPRQSRNANSPAHLREALCDHTRTWDRRHESYRA